MAMKNDRSEVYCVNRANRICPQRMGNRGIDKSVRKGDMPIGFCIVYSC